MAVLLGSRQLRLTLVITGLFGWPNSLPAQTDARWLGSRMNDWYAEASRSAPGDWGIAVADQGGQMLWSFNADASLAKVKNLATASGFAAFPVLDGEGRAVGIYCRIVQAF